MPSRFTRRQILSRLAATGTAPLLGACAALPQDSDIAVAQPARVAMLLPLSGPQAPLGKTMVKAVWLAEERAGLRQRVEIFDTGPTAQGAGAAAKLAQGEGAEVIVGPLFASHTKAVVAGAPKAQVITLSNDDRLAADGAWVFGVTPAQSAEAAAGFAKKMGASSIALLQPAGEFGAQSATALSQAAKHHRLKMMPPASSAETMLASLRAANRGALPESIYLPAADKTGRQAARIAGEAGLRAIGSLQWADVPIAEMDRMKTMTFAGPDPKLFNSLSASYRSELGEEMGIISGLAVDAVLFANGIPRDRSGRLQMNGRAPFDGLLGRCMFRKDRTCARDLAMLQTKDGQVRRAA